MYAIDHLPWQPHWLHQFPALGSTNPLSFCHKTSSNWKTQPWCWLTQQNLKEKTKTQEQTGTQKEKEKQKYKKGGRKERGHRTIMKTWRLKHLQELTNPPARKYISVVPGMDQLDTRLHVRLWEIVSKRANQWWSPQCPCTRLRPSHNEHFLRIKNIPNLLHICAHFDWVSTRIVLIILALKLPADIKWQTNRKFFCTTGWKKT